MTDKYIAWSIDSHGWFSYGHMLRRKFPNIYSHKAKKVFRMLAYDCTKTKANKQWQIPSDNDVKAFHVFYHVIENQWHIFWMVGYDLWPNGLPHGITINMVQSINHKLPFRAGKMIKEDEKSARQMIYLLEQALAKQYPNHLIV